MNIIASGYVLEANESEEAFTLSYDDMTEVGRIRLHTSPVVTHGNDLDDAPFNCNGGIYDGESIQLKKGDFVIVIRNPITPVENKEGTK